MKKLPKLLSKNALSDIYKMNLLEVEFFINSKWMTLREAAHKTYKETRRNKEIYTDPVILALLAGLHHQDIFDIWGQALSTSNDTWASIYGVLSVYRTTSKWQDHLANLEMLICNTPDKRPLLKNASMTDTLKNLNSRIAKNLDYTNISNGKIDSDFFQIYRIIDYAIAEVYFEIPEDNRVFTNILQNKFGNNMLDVVVDAPVPTELIDQILNSHPGELNKLKDFSQKVIDHYTSKVVSSQAAQKCLSDPNKIKEAIRQKIGLV